MIMEPILPKATRFALDGEVVQTSLNESTLSELDGDTLWGELGLSRQLTVGTHTITITALEDWLKADRFTFALAAIFIDDIVTVDAPEAVAPGSSPNITISYSASTDRDIVATFQQGIPPYEVYSTVVTPVNKGNGTIDIVLEIPVDITEADDEYQFQVFIAPNGGTWPDRLDNLAINQVDVSADAGPMAPEDGLLEIEDVFRVVNEAGVNNTVDADSFNVAASNGLHVRLFDTDDELAFNFEVEEEGEYIMSLRLRVGETSGTPSNLAELYAISLDGQPLDFALDSTSISEVDGDSYWGNIVRTQNLSTGTHTINIRALRDWLKADSFTYKLEDVMVFEDSLLGITGPDSVVRGGTAQIAVEYSSSEDREIVGWLQRDHPSGFVLDRVKTPVAVGKGTVELDFNIPLWTSRRLDYKFIVMMVPVDGSWSERLDDLSLAPVKIESSKSIFKISPNPVTEGRFTVQTDREYSIELRDIFGRLALQEDNLIGGQEITVGDVSTGLYFLTFIEKAGGVFRFPILIFN